MKQATVLIVENDDDVTQTMSDVLTTCGYRVRCASDALAAQDIPLKKPTMALLLTDFCMPSVDGAELLHWCRRQGLHLPVVLLSSTFSLLPQHKRALCDCCAFLLYKPFDVSNLQRVVSAALYRQHARHCLQAHAGRQRIEATR